MTSTEEIYISTDIECDGLIPGLHSMLSIGAAAFTPQSELLDTFTVNLAPLPDCAPLPQTMAWWRDFPEAWARCTHDPQPPAEAMEGYVRWVDGLPGTPVFVAYPAVFDFSFINYYLARFLRRSPFGFSALDVRSYAMALTGSSFGAATKSRMPAEWLPDRPHTHVALDDALEQGEWFCRMLIASRESRQP